MTTPTPLPHAVAIEMCSDFDEASQNCGDPNHSPESCTCLKLARAWRKMERDLAAAKEWREAVLNELIVAHIYTKEHDTNPRKAIQDAITWNCQVALDPAVSSDAQKLIAAAQEARQRAEELLKQFFLNDSPWPDVERREEMQSFIDNMTTEEIGLWGKAHPHHLCAALLIRCQRAEALAEQNAKDAERLKEELGKCRQNQ